MKILIVSKSYYPEKTIVSKIAEGLYKRGHNVTVLTSKPSFALGIYSSRISKYVL